MQPAKMQPIADQLIAKVASDPDAVLPYMVVRADDNPCSGVSIHASLEPPTAWANGIFHNSHYMIIHISPQGGQRWYDPNVSEWVTIKLSTCGEGMWKAKKLRKYTGGAAKAIQRIVDWIKYQKSHLEKK